MKYLLGGFVVELTEKGVAMLRGGKAHFKKVGAEGQIWLPEGQVDFKEAWERPKLVLALRGQELREMEEKLYAETLGFRKAYLRGRVESMKYRRRSDVIWRAEEAPKDIRYEEVTGLVYRFGMPWKEDVFGRPFDAGWESVKYPMSCERKPLSAEEEQAIEHSCVEAWEKFCQITGYPGASFRTRE